ncbi:Hypothetical protein CINCED_3A000070 [Cinara cedri]|uniref:Uncharacterized protein n=1 Tax=Cinara cedri TaxID=506608 RepID=A0A5E4NC70_9HEMI|nr:Hypothetical protein CINCED_3A000070 [Cinara cedri]
MNRGCGGRAQRQSTRARSAVLAGQNRPSGVDVVVASAVFLAALSPNITASVVEQPAAWGARRASAAGGAAAAGAAVAVAFATAAGPLRTPRQRPQQQQQQQLQHRMPLTTVFQNSIESPTAPGQVEQQQLRRPSESLPTGCQLLSSHQPPLSTATADRNPALQPLPQTLVGEEQLQQQQQSSQSSSASVTSPGRPSDASTKQQQQQLHDIEEEEDDDQLTTTLGDDDCPLSGSSCSLTVRKTANSPSPTFSSGQPAATASWAKAAAPAVTAAVATSSSAAERKRKKNLRTKSVTSTTSSDTCGSGGATERGSFAVLLTNQAAAAAAIAKMQAEQGSIGDLQKYHKFLRNRRHTLANVRRKIWYFPGTSKQKVHKVVQIIEIMSV